MPPVAGALLLTLSLAACGGASHHPRAAAPRVTVTAGARSPTGFAALPAARILADAADALAGARSYTVSGTVRQGGQLVEARYAVRAPDALAATIVRGAARELVVVTRAGVTVEANRAYWQAHEPAAGPGLLRLFAAHAFRLSGATASRLSALVPALMPAAYAACLRSALVAPRHAGRVTVAGQPAVLLASAGGPGTRPGVLAVASAAPHRPLRFTPTGPPRPGRDRACVQGAPARNGGPLSFSGFDRTRVSAPSGATPLF